ncbi:MAG TPA: mechanosensitive ion channel protein MscS [Spirochaetia bacterium]|nr:mechanosensitive ion channel protein MscS [Spirochaetia bacterium]
MDNILEIFSYNRVFTVILVLTGSYIGIKLGSAVLKKMAERYSQKRIQINGLIPIYKLLIYLFALFFIVFGILEVSKESLTALGLSLGVALGFAFQDILGNIFGGFIIIFTKPFAVGDKIQIGSFYGEVTDISLRRILIVTPDDSVVNVPNKAILTENISNSNGGELNCQVVAEIYLPITTDLDKAKKIGIDAAYSSPYAYLKKPVAIRFKYHYDQAPVILMKVKAYVFDHRYEFVFASDIVVRVQEKMKEEKML